MCLKPACSTCNKTLSHRNSIICAQCFKPIHLKCNNLNFLDGQLIKNSNSSWFCLHCSNNIFPFTNITNKKLQSVFSNEEYHVDDYVDNSINTCLLLKPQENSMNLFHEFNNISFDQNNNSENIINSKYYDIDEIQTLNKLNNKCTLSLFYINSCSLSKNIEDLKYLLNSNLMNYSHEFCPTESSAGDTLLYIRNHLSCKPRNDLCIYKATELESSFIEIFNSKRSNIIIGCIYRHPNMHLDEFNDNYLNILLDRIYEENKSVFFLGDCNIDLLKYDKHAPINEFLVSLSSHMFLPHIVQPTRISTTSKTLIDNIFSNIHAPSSISRNLTSSISDHLPQFLIVPDIFLKFVTT